LHINPGLLDSVTATPLLRPTATPIAEEILDTTNELVTFPILRAIKIRRDPKRSGYKLA
jgi:hypothetical protein